MTSTTSDLGDCPLCGRPMVSGPSVDGHHLVPQSKGGKGKDKELCHVICHRKIHSTISEGELSNYYNTWARLKDHHHMRRFIKWVRKKDPEYIDSHRDTRERNRRRR